MDWIVQQLKSHFILLFSALLALLSCVLLKPTPKELFAALNGEVLALLFAFMVVIQGLRSCHFLDAFALWLLKKNRHALSFYATFIFLVFFSSMIFTNDVALLTFVPLTLTACRFIKHNPLHLIILETIAANIGSSLTPMGNPQNLFLYSFYQMNTFALVREMLPLVVVGALLIALSLLWVVRQQGQRDLDFRCLPERPRLSPLKGLVGGFSLILVMAAVFRLVDLSIVLGVVVLLSFVIDRKTLLKVDYSLLLIFIAFFIFTHNCAQLPFLQERLPLFLQTHALGVALGLSQFLSNVPTALLLAPFCQQGESLLWGVNVGGLGTLIASLASLISYQFYKKEEESQAFLYLLYFTLYNVLFLLVLVPFALLCLKL